MARARAKNAQSSGSDFDDAETFTQRQPSSLTESQIAHRAYELYLGHEGEHGRDVDDWLQAERELREKTRLRAERD
jgi:hypothetical protein